LSIRERTMMVNSPQEKLSGGVAVKPAEFQMRFRELLERSAEQRGPAELAKEEFGPFATISRQRGSGGAEIARLLGERLGWSVLDRELVEDLAKRLRLSPQLLALVDETDSGWFRDTILNLLNSRLVLQDSYVTMLGKVMVLAAIDGRVVIVGRGAHLILPSAHGVRVRVVAPRDRRVARLRETEGLGVVAAERTIDDVDHSRAEFIRRHFHTTTDDPHNYDLVVDSSVFGAQGSVDVICKALEVRGFVGST
jgi:cytidylate kinase